MTRKPHASFAPSSCARRANGARRMNKTKSSRRPCPPGYTAAPCSRRSSPFPGHEDSADEQVHNRSGLPQDTSTYDYHIKKIKTLLLNIIDELAKDTPFQEKWIEARRWILELDTCKNVPLSLVPRPSNWNKQRGHYSLPRCANHWLTDLTPAPNGGPCRVDIPGHFTGRSVHLCDPSKLSGNKKPTIVHWRFKICVFSRFIVLKLARSMPGIRLGRCRYETSRQGRPPGKAGSGTGRTAGIAEALANGD